jgi:hypothetical protein
LVAQIFNFLPTKDFLNDITFKTFALEGTWLMANLLYGPDSIAESLLLENDQPNFIFKMIE